MKGIGRIISSNLKKFDVMNFQFGLALPAGTYSSGLTNQETLAGLLGGGTFWNPITTISYGSAGFPLSSANYSIKDSLGRNTTCSLAMVNFGAYYGPGWFDFVNAVKMYRSYAYTDAANPRLTFTKFSPGRYNIIIYYSHGYGQYNLKNKYSIYNAANTLLSSVQYNSASVGSTPTSMASLVENTHYLRISNITLPESFYILPTVTAVSSGADKPGCTGISFKKL